MLTIEDYMNGPVQEDEVSFYGNEALEKNKKNPSKVSSFPAKDIAKKTYCLRIDLPFSFMLMWKAVKAAKGIDNSVFRKLIMNYISEEFKGCKDSSAVADLLNDVNQLFNQ